MFDGKRCTTFRASKLTTTRIDGICPDSREVAAQAEESLSTELGDYLFAVERDATTARPALTFSLLPNCLPNVSVSGMSAFGHKQISRGPIRSE